MTLTKERKILAGVLGLGLAVFAADRLFLDGESDPAEAAARALTVPAHATPSVIGGGTGAMALPKPNEQSIARRLKQYAEAATLDPMQVREAFVPAESWVPTVADRVAPVAPIVVRNDPREAFIERHQLNGVVGSGTSAMAIVDGIPLRPGQLHDGFTLVEVTERSAVFASSVGRVELRLRP